MVTKKKTTKKGPAAKAPPKTLAQQPSKPEDKKTELVTISKPDMTTPLGNRARADHFIQWIPVALKHLSRKYKIDPDEAAGMFALALQKEPKLYKAIQSTIFESIQAAAIWGLEFSGATAEAYLVPFRIGRTEQFTCTLIPGYQGYLRAYLRSGQVESIQCQVVYECDEFDYQLGTQPRILHNPKWMHPDFGNDKKIVATYFTAWIKGSTQPNIEVMNKSQIDKVRAVSRAKDSPWVYWYGEMCRKTVLRRGRKWLPYSQEVSQLLQLDNQSGEFDFQGQKILEVDPLPPGQTRTKALVQKLQDDAPPEKPPAPTVSPAEEEAVRLMAVNNVPAEVYTAIVARLTKDDKTNWNSVIDALQAFVEAGKQGLAQGAPAAGSPQLTPEEELAAAQAADKKQGTMFP